MWYQSKAEIFLLVDQQIRLLVCPGNFFKHNYAHSHSTLPTGQSRTSPSLFLYKLLILIERESSFGTAKSSLSDRFTREIDVAQTRLGYLVSTHNSLGSFHDFTPLMLYLPVPEQI